MEVIQVVMHKVVMRCLSGVIPARNHHDIIVFHGSGFVNTAAIGVNPLNRETLRQIQSVVAVFLQQSFFRRDVTVVWAWRVVLGRSVVDQRAPSGGPA